MMLGVDFATDIQYPWMDTILDPKKNYDPTDRLDRALAAAIEHLGRIAGEDAEFVVRATLRMRRIDFAQVPALCEPAAIADNCARLKAAYPEKYTELGATLTHSCVTHWRATARSLEIGDSGGQFLFVLSSATLGSGFYIDPLQPWAKAVLDPLTDLSTRSARFEAEVRAHLQSSLESHFSL